MFAYMACLNPGDEIIVTDPSYANYMAFAISCGAVVKSVKTSIDDGFRLPPIEKFEEQITDKTRAILICNKRAIPSDMIEAANDNDVALFKTAETQFEASAKVAKKMLG